LHGAVRFLTLSQFLQSQPAFTPGMNACQTILRGGDSHHRPQVPPATPFEAGLDNEYSFQMRSAMWPLPPSAQSEELVEEHDAAARRKPPAGPSGNTHAPHAASGPKMRRQFRLSWDRPLEILCGTTAEIRQSKSRMGRPSTARQDRSTAAKNSQQAAGDLPGASPPEPRRRAVPLQKSCSARGLRPSSSEFEGPPGPRVPKHSSAKPACSIESGNSQPLASEVGIPWSPRPVPHLNAQPGSNSSTAAVSSPPPARRCSCNSSTAAAASPPCAGLCSSYSSTAAAATPPPGRRCSSACKSESHQGANNSAGRAASPALVPRLRGLANLGRNLQQLIASPRQPANAQQLALSPRDGLSSSLRRSRSSSSISPRLPSCPACLCPVRRDELETLGCGVHLCCFACAAQSARMQVRAGRLPRCFHQDCRAVVDPLVALRLLDFEDHDLYLRLALWTDPCVEACPQCASIIYSDTCVDAANAQCPVCSHMFCVDCRCPVHHGIDCEAAMKQRDQQMMLRFGSVGLADVAGPQSVKSCPRCNFLIEKADEDSCDHMTCVRCTHEFCWCCLADRKVIYAHGNHHHRQGCRFYAPCTEPDDFMPDRCPRCARRGLPCKPPTHSVSMHPVGCLAQRYSAFVDVCVQWWRHGGA